jgi:hypothetical protein
MEDEEEDGKKKENITRICCYTGWGFRIYSTLHVFGP